MKFNILIPILVILIVNIAYCNQKNRKNKFKKAMKKQIQIVNDQSGFGSTIDQVIRKTPSVSVENTFEYPSIAQPLDTIHFSNSNTSSQPGLSDYGRSAEIVNPTILFHSKEPFTVVKEIPAHLGYNNVQHSYTSMNKSTHQIENHVHNEKVPIYGNIQSVSTLSKETIKPFDLQYRRFRKPQTIIHENPEFDYQTDFRFPH